MSHFRSLAFRPTLLRVTLLVWLLLSGEPAWAPEDGVSLMPEGWSRLGLELDTREQARRPGPPPPGWVGILIRQAPLEPGWHVSEKPPPAWPFRSQLVHEGIRTDAQREPWQLLKLAVQGRSADGTGRLGWSGELATRPLLRRAPEADDPGVRLLWLDVGGAEKAFEYGLRYRAVGQRLLPLASPGFGRDEEGSEAWAGVRLGPALVKVSLSEDRRVPRTTTDSAGMGLTVALPDGSYWTAGYSHGDAERAPRAVALGRSPASTRSVAEPITASAVETVSSGWSRSSERRDLSLSSGVSTSRDQGGSDLLTTSIWHDLTATYRPVPKLGLSPGLSIWQDRYRWSDDRLDGLSGSLGVS